MDEFDPAYGTNQTSVIKVTDFPTTKELADFLKELAVDEERYNKYLAWKFQPPTQRFQDLTSRSMDHEFTACSLCQTVAKVKQKGNKH